MFVSVILTTLWCLLSEEDYGHYLQFKALSSSELEHGGPGTESTKNSSIQKKLIIIIKKRKLPKEKIGRVWDLPMSSCSGESSKISESDGRNGEPG